MSAPRTLLNDFEITVLLNIICHGRPDAYSPQKVWDWLEESDINSLRHCEITVFHIAPALDDLQEQGRKLDPSGHTLIMPPPELPIPHKTSNNAIPIASVMDADGDRFNEDAEASNLF